MTKTSLFTKTVTAIAVAGALAAASTGAQAKPIFLPHGHGWHSGWGPGLGIGLGVGLLAAAVASDSPRYCHAERRFDDYGNYIGRVRVCE